MRTIEYSLPSFVFEREFALLMQEIARHISYINKLSNKDQRLSQSGKFTISNRPWGISVILSASDNPLRYALAPLASSIAARNTVVLANLNSKNGSLFSIIKQAMHKYMDVFSVQIIPKCIMSEASPIRANHITIFGM